MQFNLEKILGVLGFIFINLSLYIIAVTPPSTGYEISIYAAYPAYFWFFIVIAIIFGILILLHQAFNEKKSSWWILGLGIIIFGNSILLLLPTFRGYFIYGRWDTLTHLGNIRDILVTGHIGKGNFYPILHILGTISIQVVGLSLEDIFPLFSILFINVYLFNMYLLAKSNSEHHGQVLLILAFSSSLIYSSFHVSNTPSILSLYMVPCLLYLYQEREKIIYNRQKNTFLLILLVIFITLCHPVTTLFVLILFPTYGLANAFYYRFPNKVQSKSLNANIGKNFLNITLIMFISFLTWYLSFSFIRNKIIAVYNWIVYQIGTPLLDAMLIQLGAADLTLLQTVEIFMNKYGAIFILLILSGISSLSVIYKILKKNHYDFINFIYATEFMITFFIGTIMLFGNFIEYNPIRVFRIPILIGTILSGLVVYDFINGYSKKKFDNKTISQRLTIILFISVLIIAMSTLSIGNIHGAPRVWDVNDQVTQMDISGTKWFGKLRDPNLSIVGNIEGETLRFERYHFGLFSNIYRVKLYPERLPSHFGYDEHNTIAESLGLQDKYVVIFGIDKVAQTLFSKCPSPKVHIFTEEDFDKINSDTAVARIYCNGEYETYIMWGNN